MFVMRRFAVVRRTSTVCSRSACTSQRAVEPLMVKIRDRSTVSDLLSGYFAVRFQIDYTLLVDSTFETVTKPNGDLRISIALNN